MQLQKAKVTATDAAERSTLWRALPWSLHLHTLSRAKLEEEREGLRAGFAVLPLRPELPDGDQARSNSLRTGHLGKLDFYLEALVRDVKKPQENPAIGLLLRASKDGEVVAYALSRTLSPALGATPAPIARQADVCGQAA